MKSKMNIKGIIIIAVITMVSMFFINMSFAANTGKVNVETANLRKEPNADSIILEQLSINQEVEILEKSGEWYQVKYNNITGFLRQDLVTVSGEASNTTTDTNQVNTVAENTAVDTNATIQNTATEEQPKEGIQKGTYLVSEDTKLKIVPSINATDIIEVKKEEEVNVTEVMNGWACIETMTTKGWIREEKLKSKETVEQEKKEEQNVPTEEEKTVAQETVLKTQYVKSASVNLRAEPNTSAAVVTTLTVNTSVDVYEEKDGWSKVKVKSLAKEGYISTALLSDAKQETSRGAEATRNKTQTSTTSVVKDTTTTTTTSGGGTSVVSKAQQYIGCRYVYGGSSPSGFDCSGFTSYVYKQFGVSLNRTAAGQYSNGTAVSKSQLQPGDLVMFGKSGINHVGIYIGGGRMVHAANPSRGVTTDTINSGYYANNYVGARRVM